MKKFILILIVLIARSSFAQQAGTIEKTTCFLKDCSFADKNPNIEFGYLYVPENYSDSTSQLRRMALLLSKISRPIVSQLNNDNLTSNSVEFLHLH